MSHITTEAKRLIQRFIDSGEAGNADITLLKAAQNVLDQPDGSLPANKVAEVRRILDSVLVSDPTAEGQLS